jgi:WD40 repeat protein
MIQKLLEIEGHAGAIYCSAYDGEFLYTGSGDRYVTRWNLDLGTQDKFAIKFENAIYAMDIYGKHLFVGLSDGHFHVFDIKGRKELKNYTQHITAIFSIRVNSNKNHIYVGDGEGNLSVWDLETFEQVIYLPIGCGKIRDISVDDKGERFVLACQDGTIRVFDSSNFNETHTIDAHRDGATSALFDLNDSSVIVSGGKDAMLRRWNLNSQIKTKDIPAHNFAIYRLIQLPSGFVSVSRDKTVKLWSNDLDFLKRIDFKEKAHRNSVNDCVIIDERTFATSGDDRRSILWQLDL